MKTKNKEFRVDRVGKEKDPQRIYNYMTSHMKEVEEMLLEPVPQERQEAVTKFALDLYHG